MMELAEFLTIVLCVVGFVLLVLGILAPWFIYQCHVSAQQCSKELVETNKKLAALLTIWEKLQVKKQEGKTRQAEQSSPLPPAPPLPLVICKDCGYKVLEGMSTCPHCGNPYVDGTPRATLVSKSEEDLSPPLR